MDEFQILIKEICEEEGIDYDILSKGWIIELKKDNRIKFLAGYKFDLNYHSTGLVFDDKYATYEVLKKLDVNVIEHNILFKKNSYSKCIEYFLSHNKNIVIKSNEGTCGNGVYHVTSEEEIKPILDKLFTKNISISVCPFYEIKHEYRLIMLNNECVLLYGKNKPVVIGDGIHSIKELLIKFNPNYFTNKLNNNDYDRILNKDEIYEYGWQFNLSKGFMPFEVLDINLKNELLKLSEKITKTLDLNFCSLDIINTNEGLFVIEINSGIMMKNYIEIMPNGRSIAKEIYRSAIKSMF